MKYIFILILLIISFKAFFCSRYSHVSVLVVWGGGWMDIKTAFNTMICGCWSSLHEWLGVAVYYRLPSIYLELLVSWLLTIPGKMKCSAKSYCVYLVVVGFGVEEGTQGLLYYSVSWVPDSSSVCLKYKALPFHPCSLGLQMWNPKITRGELHFWSI